MSQRTFRRVFVSALALAFTVGAITPHLASADDRPFKARLAGNTKWSPTPEPTVVRNDETAEGQATHLGRFTWKSVEFVTFVPGGVEVEGTFVMTAANGDKVFGTYETTGAVNGDGNLIIHGAY